MSAARRHAGRRRGLTVLELLIALTITSLTGLAIATVTSAVARSLSSVNGERSALQRAHVLRYRVSSYTRTGLALLAADDARGFVVWLHDGNLDRRPNLTELRVFWFDAEAEELELERVVFPEDWPQEWKDQADTPLSSVADPFEAVLVERAEGYTTRELVADGLVALSLVPSAEVVWQAPRFAMHVELRLDDDSTDELLFSTGFLNHEVPQ